jgi:ribonuclease G
LGVIENKVPSLEAFFVNIGLGKNGFLRYRDVLGEPNHYNVGDKILVQVRKDGGTRKGPQLAMQLSLPGKYLVYIPNSDESIGISRKILQEKERTRLRQIAKKILIDNESIIFRTNSEGIDDKEVEVELKEMRKTYNNILQRFQSQNNPGVLYEESDFLEYILRERLDSKTKKIITDDRQIFRKLKKGLKSFELKTKVEYVKGDIFQIYNIYHQMEEIFTKKIELSGGGTITLDRAEALTAIDVDSAGNLEGKNIEETSFITNMEAAKEIARQLKLRNIGGMIVVDFIDMKDSSHKKTIINILKEESKKDKSKVTILGFTNMGLLEIIRKRTTQPLDTNVYSQCPLCHGTGKIIAPSIIQGRLIKELLSSIKEIRKDKIKVIEINAFHNLSGYLTPYLTEELEKKLNVKLEVSFNWQNPNSYNIKYKK